MVGGGLTRRTIVASALLALVVGVVFAILVRAVTEERDSADLAIRSQEMIAAAGRLERLVLDLETGQRGYIITRQERFLQPWQAARDSQVPAGDALVRASDGVNGQARLAREIAAAVNHYVTRYSVPLVEAARQGRVSASSPAVLDEGRRRVDALRTRFDSFVDAERRRFAVRQEDADLDSNRAVFVAAAGLAGLTLLIALFGSYLTRAVALPVRHAAVMAGRLAGGDLSTRMSETGTGEVGALERAFNTMAGSLEESRDDLRRLAEEQAALRRVATLVARDVPPDELFRAAASEVRTVLGADITALLRHEEDGTVSRLAVSADDGVEIPDGDGIELAGETVTVTAPIMVGARLWGVTAAGWTRDAALAPDVEERMAQFTELIATAIANAQSRAELAASRARVVATADETRRRIERDLHDGAQQSLVHTVITLKLARRALGDETGPAVELVHDALEHAERANTELRDLAHGILPATLSRGLGAAIETLVSRVRLPVSVDVTAERVAPDLEATAYFIVAEALTNTVKHAHASRATVSAAVEDGMLRVEVRDDGIGGARADGRSGLLGLNDRVGAMDGELRVDSPPGGGTTIAVRLPIL